MLHGQDNVLRICERQYLKAMLYGILWV